MASDLFRRATQADPSMSHTYTAWARFEASKGNIKEAREIFEEGHVQDTQHAPLLHAWAEFELSEDRVSAARKLLQKSLKHNPKHLPSWMSLGRLEWLIGDRDKARGIFEEGNTRAGPSPQLMHTWAQLELQSHDIRSARTIMHRIWSVAPDHLPSRAAAAKMEDRARHVLRSGQLYKELLASQPDNPRVLHAAISRLLRVGDAAAAAPLMDRLEALSPLNGFLCHTRGLAALSEGEPEAASSWFKRGLQAECLEGSLLSHEGLGELLAWQGRPLEARAAFEAGWRRWSNLAPGRMGAGQACGRYLRQWALFEKRQGNFDASSELFSRAARKNPLDYKTWLQWAVQENRRGRFAKAEVCFERAAKLAPGNPQVWYAFAVMFVRRGDVAGAREMFAQGTALCGRAATLWMEWAILEEQEGNIARARELFEAGSSVPGSYQHPPLYEAWARLESKAGERERAAQLQERSLELSQLQRRGGSQSGDRPASAPL